ncbi:hypothetical protein SAMN05421770_101839 [Granulicella rosea]|uniref:DUF932 domain-containing protein n=1 Tax=Granulicella rosea TaxID=474952 RepID=A0A239E783_9BACT|nr:hypothetical protein [Granulicella rosea]SNS40585.1 hypothetical protein SAMN05421770_101839 [Granulicella rosea]
MLLTMQSKTAASHKLEQLIARGRSKAGEVVNHVMNHQPSDRLARGGELSFEADPEAKTITISYPDLQASAIRQRLHRHSIQQMAQTTDLPLKFIDGLQQTSAPWGRELLAHNLTTVFANRFDRSRYLLRSVQGEVRGFLSDRYRRLDSRPIIEAFATAVQQKGALPYDGYVTDTKVALQAIMPEVYEPIPGEMVAYGLSLENSDFGNGALSIRAYLLRIWCSNLAITQEEMRQVHLGKRLDDSMLYSQRTYELDAQTTVSALRDVVSSQLNADSLRRRMEAVRHANEQSVDPGSAREMLRKTLLKSESDAVIEAYNSPDAYNMPAGNTTWRLSNAISWIAGSTEDAERKLELMKFAGEVLPKAA